MRQLAVVSGKGGTGKTSLVGAFTRLAGRSIAVDADVEGSNLAIVLPGDDGPWSDFFAGRRARIDPERCDGCGSCVDSCRFSALRHAGPGVLSDPLRCVGCGTCAQVCERDAVAFVSNRAGAWAVRTQRWGFLVHAELGVAQDNSGKLVAHLRQQALELASSAAVEQILIDGPPGIGCPVHAAITGVDALVVVTEPSAAAAHDLGRILDLAGRFGLPAGVILNKADLHEAGAALVSSVASRHGAPLLGRIPFDPEVPRALARGETEWTSRWLSGAVEDAWEAASAMLEEGTRGPRMNRGVLVSHAPRR